MTDEKPRRGRPKGSGIDDRSRLEAIANMIAADPTLKPTTAIKCIGISDPSIIRRLRDKYHAMQPELAAELGLESLGLGGHDDDFMPGPEPSGGGSRVMAAGFGSAVRKSPVPEARCESNSPISRPRPVAPVGSGAATGPSERASTPPAPAPDAAASSPLIPGLAPGAAELASMWWTMGLRMANTMAEAQLALSSQLVHLPHVAMVLRQQVILNQLAMAMIAAPKWSRPKPG